MPVQLTFACEISPDGRRVACINPDHGLEVWDTEPLTRWPVAVAAGIVVAGLVLLPVHLKRVRR
jgi:hypothetical protein